MRPLEDVRILAVEHCYPDAFRFFETMLRRFGVGVDYVDGANLDRVAEMTREGSTVRDISSELNLSKSKVQRMQAKLRAEGRL